MHALEIYKKINGGEANNNEGKAPQVIPIGMAPNVGMPASWFVIF